MTYLPHRGPIIPSEAAGISIDCRYDVSQALTIDILGIGAHPRDGEHLLVLQHTLLELAEEDAETCTIEVRAISMHC